MVERLSLEDIQRDYPNNITAEALARYLGKSLKTFATWRKNGCSRLQ